MDHTDLTKLFQSRITGSIERDAEVMAEKIRQMSMRQVMILFRAMGIITQEMAPKKEEKE